MSIKTNFIKKVILVFLISIISTSLIFISFAGQNIYAGDAITVFLDPGHGGSDSGCIHNGLKEKDINLAISLKLKSLLESNGFNVIMRRANDSGMSLDDIVNTANKSGADLFLSIHNNASLSPASAGTETYWSANGVGGSSQFAASIQSNLVSAIGKPNRGVKSADFRVIKNTKMTAALVEGVFVSNPDEANLLKDGGFLDKMARGLFNGISSYAKNITPSSGGTTGGTYAAKRVLVNVDAPTNGQTIGGNFELIGWAVEEGGITSPEIDAVHVYDGPAAGAQNLIGIANYGISRPDVAASFGKDAFTKSGYSLMINCNTLTKGTHIIHVYAHNQVLGWGYATVKVNVLNDGTVVPASQGGVNTPVQGSTDPATVNGTTQTDTTTTSGDSNTNYESSGDKKVLISLDSPKNGQNVSGIFELTGWAIEASALNCTGITSVHVYDGKANGEQNMLGVAEYGIARPDVADSFGRSGFKNCGFNLNIDSSKMADGSHTLYIYAYNHYLGWKYATVKVNVANGGSTQTASNSTTSENIYLSQTKANITENNSSSGYLSSGVQKVLINVDTPQAGQQLSGKFDIAGWAVERSAVNSTGITAIHLYDGKANGSSNFLGVATYGIARSDVSDYFGKNNLKNSGFKLTVDSSKLSNGNHTLYVYAYNQNLGWKYSTVNINIGGSTQSSTTQTITTNTQGTASANTTYTSSGKPQTLINVDTPAFGQSVSGTFELAGWAVEQSAVDTTGITTVHVYNGPANGEQNMLGVAEYGIARPDVASGLGKGNFTNSGFRLMINSAKLTNGEHTLYIYAHNPNIGWKYTTVKINYTGTGSTSTTTAPSSGGAITNSTNMVGYVDVTVDQLVRIFEIRGSSKTNWARRLAPLYIKWGQQFNIRADIAWAMMAHETGFLEYNGVADPSWNNFCGLGVTGPAGVGCRFESEELGVIAQYAHLAWYAYPSHINNYCSKTYDPRHSDGHYYNGNSSVGTLNGRWAPASTYTDKILLFANQIFGR